VYRCLLQALGLGEHADRFDKRLGFSKDPEGKVMARYRDVLPRDLMQRLPPNCDLDWQHKSMLQLPSDLKVSSISSSCAADVEAL
jgi:hypothetical protein